LLPERLETRWMLSASPAGYQSAGAAAVAEYSTEDWTFAAEVKTYGDVELIRAPASVRFGDLESNSTVFLFRERRDHTLTRDIAVDLLPPAHRVWAPGAPAPPASLGLETGKTVDSYFLHADPRYGVTFRRGTMVFDRPIVAVIMATEKLHPSDLEFGAPGTRYPTGFPLRGTLGADDIAWISPDRRTLSVALTSLWPGDQMRILVEAEQSLSFALSNVEPGMVAGRTQDGRATQASNAVDSINPVGLPSDAVAAAARAKTGSSSTVVADYERALVDFDEIVAKAKSPRRTPISLAVLDEALSSNWD
jgi:hypothetical protein